MKRQEQGGEMTHNIDPMLGPHRLSRRQLLAKGTGLALGLPTWALLAAACGNEQVEGGTAASVTPSAPPELSGTLVFDNYAGWIGKHEVENFETLYPDADIKQISGVLGSPAASVQRIKNDPDLYDMSLQDIAFVGQVLLIGDIIQELDFDRIPNIKYVNQRFRDSFPHGIPTDYGKTGIAYRKDIVKETITSWADLWDLAPKYSGQIVFFNFDNTVIGSALKYLGYSGNSHDEGELEQAKQALLEIKPHLQALIDYGVGTRLVKGTAAIGMDYDADVALAQQDEPNIEWVIPEEGLMAYLEGWIAAKDTPELDIVYEFMNFHLDPKNYGDFVNSTFSAYVMDAATPFIEPAIANSPTLKFDEATLAEVEYEDFKGDAAPLWAQVWDEFKSA
jgi:spermidine/putrescine transport system substrate-binding protein